MTTLLKISLLILAITADVLSTLYAMRLLRFRKELKDMAGSSSARAMKAAAEAERMSRKLEISTCLTVSLIIGAIMAFSINMQ